MASFKVLGLLAIASTVFSLNTDSLTAQVTIGNSSPTALSPAHQMLLEMQQSNAPAVGGGSMQLLRFTDRDVSFAPLEGLDRLFNWQVSEEEGVVPEKTMGDRVEKFKLNQRQQIVSDSKMLQPINRIKSQN
ncbi:MAG: hypothetical protein ACK5EH_17025 [Pseudanabaena sp.]